MELFAALNEYTGGLLVALIMASVAGWLSQRRRLDKIETQFGALTETLNHPKIGMVPRIEFENHRDETRQRIIRIETKAS